MIHKFDPPLDTAAAVDPKNYTLVSTTDANYACRRRQSGFGVPQDEGQRDRPGVAELQLHARTHRLS